MDIASYRFSNGFVIMNSFYNIYNIVLNKTRYGECVTPPLFFQAKVFIVIHNFVIVYLLTFGCDLSQALRHERCTRCIMMISLQITS